MGNQAVSGAIFALCLQKNRPKKKTTSPFIYLFSSPHSDSQNCPLVFYSTPYYTPPFLSPLAGYPSVGRKLLLSLQGMIEYLILLASVIVFAGIIIGKVGSRYGIPALLLFLFTGMLFGSDGFGFQFEDAEIAQHIGMVALAIILFTGGMDTKLRDIRPIMLPGLLLSTLGVLLTTLFTGLFIYLISKNFALGVTLSLPLSLLLAATMSSTDSASVFALLRSQRVHLKHNLKPILELESGSNDPMAYMLTIALISFLLQSELSIGALLLHFVQQFVLGGALGLFFGWSAVWLVNRIQIPNRTLYPIMLLCILFFTFALTSIIQGNGYLAVYITGIVLGNAKLRHRGSINHFFDGITWLVQIILFIMLGLLVNPNELLSVGILGVLIALFMMVVGRPLAVHITLIPFRRLGFKAKGFLSWVGLRGAAPIIFATYPVVSGISGSSILFNIVFIVTLLSLLIQGMTITPMARLLGLAKPAPPEGNFIGVEIPDELGTQMQEREVRKEMLAKGDELRQIELLETELVILVRRKNRFIVPKGALKLHVGDILLIVSEHSQQSASDDGHHQLIERIRKSLLQ